MPTGTTKTGLSAQVGWAEEPTFGVFQTPDHFVDFVSESLSLDISRVEGKGIRSGQLFLRSDHWTPGKKAVKGDLALELMNRGYGQMLELCIGGSATTATATGGLTTFTWTPGAQKSATIQVGVPNTTDTTLKPYNFLGAVVDSWKLSAKVDGTVDFIPTFVGANLDPGVSATAVATASYATGLELLTFVGASLAINGSAIPVHSVDWDCKNALDSSRYFLGTQLMSQPLQGALRDYGGTFEAEVPNNSNLLNLYLNGTEATILCTYAGIVNPTHKLVITANARFDGSVASVTGPGIVNQPITFKVIDNGSAFSAAYTTLDSTP